jgi:NADH-quinone oxidoreductase subunit N
VNDIEKALTGFMPNLWPEEVLGLVACVLFLGATFKFSRHVWGTMALVSLVGAAVAMAWCPTTPPTDVERFNAPVVSGQLAVFFKGLALATGFVLVLVGWDEGGEERAAEYHACLLLITAGTSLVGCANDLITLFLALELISIPTYVLLYLPRTTPQAQEAAMKYFLLSVFSSTLLLFGFSYLYGVTGTTNLPGILEALQSAASAGKTVPFRGLVLVSLVMVVAGLGFRITAVPFHFYAPDVYQGTTNPSAALLSIVPKIAGFAALVRVLGFVPGMLAAGTGASPLGQQVPHLLWILAAVTMTLGNLLALWQDNIRRMLAYSSIANAGYMLIGLAAVPWMKGAAAPENMVGGVEAMLFYLVAYGAMTVGAFAILHLLSNSGRPVETVDDLAGLGRSHPILALTMVVFLLSMIGIPLTAGFLGKLQLFAIAVTLATGGPAGSESEPVSQNTLYAILAVVTAVNAAIGAWYYLRLAVAMYLRDGEEPLPKLKPAPALVAVAVCLVLTVGLGVFPIPVQQVLSKAMNPPKEEPEKPRARAAPMPGPRLAMR